MLGVTSGPTGQNVVLVDTSDGHIRWSIPAQDLVPAGADPTLGLSVGWLPDGRWAAAGPAGLLLADADGRLEHTIAWPMGLQPFLPDLLHVTPDGSVAIADSTHSALVNPTDGTVTQLTLDRVCASGHRRARWPPWT